MAPLPPPTGASSMEQGMVFATANGLPPAQGLYDSRNEHDACGVGFVANMHNAKSHELVRMGLQILLNLDHRGAVGADPKAGDGCGMLMQIPHRFFVGGGRAPRLRAAGARRFTLSAPCSCRATPRRARSLRGSSSASSPSMARSCSAGATCRSIRAASARRSSRPSPPSPDFHRPRRSTRRTRQTFERKLFLIRKIVSNTVYALHEPQDAGLVSGLAVLAHHRLQGPAARHRSSAIISRTCATSASKPPSRSCTSASRPTPSRPGSSPIPTAWSRITARSTPCAAMSTGWRRARPRSPRRCSATTFQSCGRSPTKASRTPPVSTMRSNSWCRAAIPWPTP